MQCTCKSSVFAQNRDTKQASINKAGRALTDIINDGGTIQSSRVANVNSLCKGCILLAKRRKDVHFCEFQAIIVKLLEVNEHNIFCF